MPDGRKWMMIIGFLCDFILFIVPAFRYDYYTSPAGIHAFQAMYFLSSFFNQFGPNSVTFLVAAEVFPVSVRATAHGLSAAAGKLGALHAAVMYNYITTRQKFYIVPWFGLAGALVTFLFLPDTTGLDLKEQERRWHYIRQGRSQDYHGIAIHPKHLSVWERLRGVHKNYDPELDFRSKVDELRAEWLAQQKAQTSEKGVGLDSPDFDWDADDDEWTPEMRQYFTRTSAKAENGVLAKTKGGGDDEGAGVDSES